MAEIITHIVFFIVTIYALIPAISYGLYEIREQKNKSGGIVVITFSVIIVIAANAMMSIN